MGSSDQVVAAHMAERSASSSADVNAVLMAMAAHDLRQPLHIIARCFDWLAEPHARNREATYLQHGRAAVRQLTDQLDRLADAMRIHARGPETELVPVGLQLLFHRLRQDNEDAAERAGIDLRVASTSATVMSDAAVLDSMLRNLVRNAIKYTERGGRVLVGCRPHGANVRIEVHDNGAGIPGHALAQIFEAFHRLDSGVSDGLGLGLFVVRHAAELLGHGIEVQSRLGRGSRFSVVAKSGAAVPSISSASRTIPRAQALQCIRLAI